MAEHVPARGIPVSLGPAGPNRRLGASGSSAAASSRDAGARALDLERDFREAWGDDAFRPNSPAPTSYAGRPTPVTECHRLSNARRSWLLKREDLAHTDRTDQQSSARRCSPGGWQAGVIAETGAGQHGVAHRHRSGVVRSRLPRFMGAVDVERQGSTCSQKSLAPTSFPSQRQLHTEGGSRSAARLGRDGRDHALLHRVRGGPASVSVDGAGVPTRRRRRGVPAVPRHLGTDPTSSSLFGGGSTRSHFAASSTRRAAVVGVEAGGHGLESGSTALGSRGVPGVLHAPVAVPEDEDGQSSRRTRSARGSTTRASVRSTRNSRPRAERVRYATETRPRRASTSSRSPRGSFPPRPAHATDGWPGGGTRVPAGPRCWSHSGPGDRTRSYRRAPHGRTVLTGSLEGIARPARAGLKLLVPYITGGLGGDDRGAPCPRRCRADAVEVASRSPIGDGRRHHPGGVATALVHGRAGRDHLRDRRRKVRDPARGDDYTTRSAPGLPPSPPRSQGQHRGAIVPTSSRRVRPGAEGPTAPGGNVAARGAAHPDAGLRAICERSRGFVYGVALMGLPARAARWRPRRDGGSAARRHRQAVLLGVGISNATRRWGERLRDGWWSAAPRGAPGWRVAADGAHSFVRELRVALDDSTRVVA